MTDEMMLEMTASGIAESFRAETAAACKHFELRSSAEEDIRRTLCARIRRLIEKTVTVLFLEYLNSEDMIDVYIEDGGTDRLDTLRASFTEAVTADAGEWSLKERFPALYELCTNAAEQHEAAVRELLERLSSDKKKLSVLMPDGKDFSCVTGLDMGKGDVHNHGRSAAVITTDAGRVVYKPHDMRIDRKAYELTEGFFYDVMKAPRVICGDGYGFAEFIENRRAETDEDAERYFYDLGGLSAAALVLGSSDLHHSNILAQEICPVIIDYELLTAPGSGRSAGADRDVEFSLLQSSLMPRRRGDTELSVLFARDEENPGSPLVGGRLLCVQDHPESFLDGFRDIYRRCMDRRDELKTFADSLEGIYVRHIYRNTRAYQELINKTLEPSWILSGERGDALFRELSVAMSRSGASDADDITRAETEAVLRGDIPYMYARTDSPDLYADGRVVYRDFFRTSCIENIKARADHLSEEDLEFEEALLRKAIRSGVVRKERDMPETPEICIGGHERISGDELAAEAEQIFREIYEEALHTPSGGTLWLGPDYYLETGMNPVGGGLIDGTAGMAVFFAALYMLSGDCETRRRCRELNDMIISRLEERINSLKEMDVIYPNVENISFASGLAGKLLACRLVGKYTGDERCDMLMKDMISLMQRAELSHVKTDVFSGLAGPLKLICGCSELFALPGAGEVCSMLALRLRDRAAIPYKGRYLWRTLSPEWPVSGSGHGQSGVASALWLAGRMLGRADYAECAAAGFDFEKESYSEKLGTWPDRRRSESAESYLTGYCSGAPGIGLDALRLGYDGSDEIVGKAVQSCLGEPLQHKDFLCCGNSAITEFLLEAGTSGWGQDLTAAAESRMKLVIERAHERGYYCCVNKGVENICSPTLFYGTAGIGYEMLRLAAPDRVESVLI